MKYHELRLRAIDTEFYSSEFNLHFRQPRHAGERREDGVLRVHGEHSLNLKFKSQGNYEA